MAFTSTVGQVMESIFRCAGIGRSACTIEVEASSMGNALLRTPFRAEAVSTGTLVALGIQASRLAGLDVPRQKVTVDTRLAAAAIRQDRYMLRNNIPPKLWDPFSGLYRVGDGRWIQFHCNFSRHRDIVLGHFGLQASTSQKQVLIECVASETDAFQLEKTLTEKGAAVAVVRSEEEWGASPHGQVVKNMPLFEIQEIAADPQDPGPSRRAYKVPKLGPLLGGVKCLDFSRVIAGPMAGRTLADFGAQVISMGAEHVEYHEAARWVTGHGTQFANLDLRDAQGQSELKSLLKDTNIVINAFRPGCMDKFGLSSLELAKAYPGIIVIELSAYSDTGPWAGKRGFDSLVQCATGLVHTHSQALGIDSSSCPVHLPVQLLDYTTGYLAAIAGMQALERRSKDSEDTPNSYIIKLSLCQTASWLKSLGLKEDQAEWEAATDVPAAELQDHLVTLDLPAPGSGSLTTLDVPLKMAARGPVLGPAPCF